MAAWLRQQGWLVAAGVGLALFPLLGPASHVLLKAIEVFVFAVYALSYDLLMGVTGIVSFGHALFFGAGIYALALMVSRAHLPLWLALPGIIVFCALLAALIGSLSLRVRGHFFAMITLAFAELGHIVAQKWYKLTGGDDGMTIVLPRIFQNRLLGYYLALIFMVAAYVFLRRLVQSPTGRVLVAIRENEFRAGALGYHVTMYKVAAFSISGVLAGLAGATYGMVGPRFVSPELLTADLTIQALLMTIIGGVGTLTGPMLGAGVVRLLSTYLAGLRSVHPIFARWPLLFGLVYIAIVLLLPRGIVGTYFARLQAIASRRAAGRV